MRTYGWLSIDRYDLTGESRWIAAAEQAALYSETWTYSWDVKIPTGDPGTVYPTVAGYAYDS